MSDVTEVKGKRFRDSLKGAHVKLMIAAPTVMLLAASASAATIDINGTIGPILDSMITLIPTIINLIIAIVPAILVMAVVGFIVTFFDRILQMLHL